MDGLQIQGLAMPALEIVNNEQRQTAHENAFNAEMTKVEKKVVVNASLLLIAANSADQCARQIADCLADAVGLGVDFSALAA